MTIPYQAVLGGGGVLFCLYVLVVMPWLLDTFEDDWPWRRKRSGEQGDGSVP